MPFFGSAGLVVRGAFSSRPTDLAGLGIVYGHFSGDLQDSQRRAALLDSTVGAQQHEIALEMTYRFRFLGDAFFFQPDLQYVIRPGGTGQIPDALVAGLQTGVNL
jgi:porin